MKTTAAKAMLPSDLSPLHEISETAATAVLAAGDIQRRHFGTGVEAELIHPKDLKMAVDRECEDAIVAMIRDRFPRHRILAEEGGDLGGDGDYLWIIDPLDGTVNYFHGLPQFCACVACCYLPKEKPLPAQDADLLDSILVGAVYAPLLDELYVGITGEGATCNGKPIFCSLHKHLSEVIVALSFGKTNAGIDHMVELCRILARRARKLRSFGSAGLDIVQVAGGRFGGLLYRGIHIWDIAAAGAVLKESGGMLTAAVQQDGTWNIIAAAPGINSKLLQIVSVPCPPD